MSGATGARRERYRATSSFLERQTFQHNFYIQGSRGTLRAGPVCDVSTRRSPHAVAEKPANAFVNAFVESASSVAQLLWNAVLFVTGRISTLSGTSYFVRVFYESLATNNVMPVGLDQGPRRCSLDGACRTRRGLRQDQILSQYQPGNRPVVVVTARDGLLAAALQTAYQRDESSACCARLPPSGMLEHHRSRSSRELGDPKPLIGPSKGATAVFHIGRRCGDDGAIAGWYWL